MDYKLYIGFVIIGMIVEIAPITINYSGTENETTQAPTTEDPNSFSTPITINYSGTENETTQSPTTEGPNSFSTPVVINSVGSGTENGTTQSPTTEDPNSFSTPVVINSVGSGTENGTTQSPTTEDPNSFSTPVEINYSGAENETTQSPTTEGPNSFSKSSGKSGYIDVVTDNTGVIIGVVISLLLVALILFVAFRYWRKRKSSNYVMEDEEIEAPRPNDSSTTHIHVHTNMHMQPTSPLPGRSLDTIELDEKQNLAVYAGPGRGQPAENGDNGKGPEEKEPDVDNSQPADDNTDDVVDNKAEDTSKMNEKCVTSVVMDIASGGRVVSVSDGDEEKSPALNKEVELPIGEEAESLEDDSSFAEPPHSPLGEVRVPLASEENILTSLGPEEVEHAASEEPVGLESEKEKETESKKSRSSSTSSSNSSSSQGDKHAITTEM